MVVDIEENAKDGDGAGSLQAAGPVDPPPILLTWSPPTGGFVYPLASASTSSAALVNMSLRTSIDHPKGAEGCPPPAVPEVPSFFSGSYAPEVPKEVVTPLGATDAALKRF